MGSVNQRYDWKRFWCPREGRLWGDADGYLLDPDGESSWYPKSATIPFPVAFEAIKEKPCLLLLGEPGIGKTDAMEVERRKAAASLLPGEELLAIDCRVHRKLDKFLFNDAKFEGWLENKHTLHLFIDSLDEHPDDGAAADILGELSRGPIERLRLRIACRTAEVPPILEPELQKQWGVDPEGKSRVAVYELAPLRKKDVALAAHIAGLDADAFLSEVAIRGATALAIKPVTLGFLLRSFHSKRALPKTRWEIYEAGCRALCEEASDSRRTHKQKGRLDWPKRMAIAGRIAAACMLGNRSKIYLDSDPGDLPEDALLAESLKGKSERAGKEKVRVDATAVQETLIMTGLFTEHGRPRLLGWAHQTYAEFLTARFLRERGLGLEDLAGILYPPGERVQIVPALREVAAWMASVDVRMFRKLVEDDPRTLLQSDVAMVDDVEREKLVAALLERFANRSLIDMDVGGDRVYRKLQHPGLKEQLEPWIRGKGRDFMARRAAIDIAEACRVQALQGTLVNIALDVTDDVNTRVQAAHAVATIGDEQARLRLLPLALGQAGPDSNDELKGCALTALWPRQMSAKDLFQCLTLPRRTGFYGAYRSFVSRLETESRFSDADLVHALGWVAAQQPSRDPLDPFAALSVTVIRQAWERMDDPAVLAALVRLAEIRFCRHEHLFTDRHGRMQQDVPSFDGDARRKKFVGAFLETTDPLEREYLVLHIDKLLAPDDIPWMVERLDASTHPFARRRWATLIEGALCHKGFVLEPLERILEAWPRHPELRDVLRWLEPVELGSVREAEMRKTWAEYEERAAESARFRAEHQNRVPDPPPVERLLRCLDRFEQGDTNAFWQMQPEMWTGQTSTSYDYYRPDLTKSPGWQDADEETRGRTLAAAKRYIMTHDPKPERWLGKRVYYWPAIGGYRGFFLLWTREPDWVEALPFPVWQRWAPGILCYPAGFHDQPTREIHRHLVGLAYHHAPDETLSTLNVLVDEESRTNDAVFITRELSHCWDARLGSFLFLKAQSSSLKTEFWGSLLDELLDHRVAGVREYAASLLTVPLPKRGKARKRARLAAQALFRQAEDAGWSILESVFRDDPAFGHKVVLDAASRIDIRRDTRWQGLSEDQLADLFSWMEEQFPHEEDRNRFTGRMQTVTPRDSVADVRNALLTALSQRGTKTSVEAIRRIEQALPGKDWIQFTLIRAEEHALAGARQLLSPEEVIALRPRAALAPSTHDTRTMNERKTNTKRLVERCDVLLMTATEIETKAVLRTAAAATGHGARLIPGKIKIYHDLGTIGGAHVLLVESEMGAKTQGGSMSTTLRAISELDPQSVIMVGIAFGVNPIEQPIGRILVSEHLQDYELLRYGTDERTKAPVLKHRGVKVPAFPRLLNLFRTAKLSWDDGDFGSVDFCLMLSGDKLVDNIDFRDQLVEHFPEAKGGEMEAIGVYVAAGEEKVDWIIVKAICDHADGNKHEKKAERQALAAGRAASFVFHALGLGALAPRAP